MAERGGKRRVRIGGKVWKRKKINKKSGDEEDWSRKVHAINVL